jgi:hypothetical protein
MTQRDFPREQAPTWVVQTVYTHAFGPSGPCAAPRPAPALVTCRYCSSRVEDGARCSHCGATDRWRKP